MKGSRLRESIFTAYTCGSRIVFEVFFEWRGQLRLIGNDVMDLVMARSLSPKCEVITCQGAKVNIRPRTSTFHPLAVS